MLGLEFGDTCYVRENFVRNRTIIEVWCYINNNINTRGLCLTLEDVFREESFLIQPNRADSVLAIPLIREILAGVILRIRG